MRSFTGLAITLALAATGSSANPLVQERAACNADNCARLVTGTRAGLPSTRLADCSSFQLVKVTPAPVYTTVTVTPVASVVTTITTNPVFDDSTVTVSGYTVVRQSPVTTASSSSAAPARRAAEGAEEQEQQGEVTTPTTASPTAIPSYAAIVCSPSARYASACSCAGVTKSTTTLPAPRSTVQVTASTSATVFVPTAATTTVERTVTETQVATKTGYPCGSTVQGNGIYTFRSYKVNCGQRVTNGTVAQTEVDGQESDCLRSCNSVKYCVYAEYQFSSGRCNIYYNNAPIAIVDDPNWDALVLASG